jgi:hypothetical protein
LPPKEIIIEAGDEDQAWEKFDAQIIQAIADAYICKEVEEGGN